MTKKIIILIIFLFLMFLILGRINALSIEIIPLKKPILTKEELQKKVLVNILKPLAKPKKIKTQKIVKEDKKDASNPKFIIPKKKPIIANIDKKIKIKKSKYYSQKDFSVAQKAIKEMKKSKWDNALKISKKAKDKSIYNFIQWRHLLTKGNQASYYDYKIFISRNENYPRINRIKYLSEHKLSTDKVSPQKIINSYTSSDPLS